MFLRKKPLIDANWLLGAPAPKQPKGPTNRHPWLWTFATAAAIAGAWFVLSDLSLRGKITTENTDQFNSLQQQILGNKPIQSSELAQRQFQEFDSLDQTLLHTVDRFVPQSQGSPSTAQANPNIKSEFATPLSFARSTPTYDLPFDLAKFEGEGTLLPNFIPISDLNSQHYSSIPIDLLAADAKPISEPKSIQPNEIRPRAFVSNQNAGRVTPRPLQNQAATEQSVMRTVSYKGRLGIEDANAQSEPQGINQLRSPSPTNPSSGLSGVSPDSSTPVDPDIQLAGLSSRSTGEVVQLLASVQPKIAGAAMHELRRRKMSDAHIQLALELVSGNVEARIKALDRLIQEQNIAPLPWLVWMAEDQDRRVREHSIRILGSVADDDALREMRLLMNREKDENLRNLLRQLCAAAGSKTLP